MGECDEQAVNREMFPPKTIDREPLYWVDGVVFVDLFAAVSSFGDCGLIDDADTQGKSIH